MASYMALGQKYTLMGPLSRDSLSRESNQARDSTSGQVEQLMMARFVKMTSTALAFTSGLTGEPTRATGRMERCTATVSTLARTANNMRVPMSMVRRKAGEFSLGPMDVSTTVNGSRVGSMGKARFLNLTGGPTRNELESGPTATLSSGLKNEFVLNRQRKSDIF